MALIDVCKVRKEYRLGQTTVTALNGVDLCINKSEFIAVWGPSGSGKTTLLNLIGAIDEPTSGEVFVNDQNTNNLTDNRRSELRNTTIGFIFQHFNLIPVLSALENVMLPLQINGIAKLQASQIARSRLEAVGLVDFLQHRPDRLSGGQQQRVSIARALAMNPSVVIADEPTANLDSETAKNVINLMRKLNEEEDVTFIFSTHDPRLLNEVKRTVRLQDGKIDNGGN